MKLTAPTSVNETAQTQAQSSNCDWDSLIGGGDLEDQLDAALEQGDAEDAAAGSLIDTGEQAAEPTEEAEAIEVPANPWPDDPRIDNESTYYTEGWQEIPVPISEIQQSDNSLPSVDQPRTSADDADALERIRSAQDEVDRLHEEWEDLKNEAKDAKKRWEAAVKRQGELIKELTTPLPLFDGGKKQEQGQAKAETAPQLVVEPETKPEESPVLPDEAIGTKRVKLTADLSMEGEQGNDITIGLAGDIKTAYVSQHGELYLTFGLSDRWLLQPEEYDELPEQEHPAADSIPVVDENAWRQTPIGSLDIPKGLVQILEEDNNIRTIGDMSDWVKAHADSPDPLLELKKVGPAKAEAYRKAEAKFWETIGS